MLKIAAFPTAGPYTECLYRALRKQGVRVCTGDFSINSWLRREVRSIDWFHFHWPSHAYAYRGDLFKTLHALLRFLLFLALIRLYGKRILWTAHNLMPHEKGRRFSVVLDVFMRHVIIAFSSCILVHGPTAAATLVARFPAARKKLHVIDHGHFIGYYPNAMSRERARAQLDIPADTYLYLFIGICRRYKKIPALIEAFKRLPPGAMLFVCGKFQEDGYLEEVLACAAGHEAAIKIVPAHIPDDQMQVYLNASDSVVLPYGEILTSGAAMLAISFGRPVVAPRKGNLKDVVNSDCGVLYDPADTDGLQGAMLAARARQFDSRTIVDHALRYDWDGIAAAIHARLTGAATTVSDIAAHAKTMRARKASARLTRTRFVSRSRLRRSS